MRSRAVVTAVVLAIMILVPRLSGAVGVHYFDCKECHKTGMAITQLGDSNVCRQCHNDPTVPTLTNSGATVDPGTGFLAGDASNVYGTAQPTGNYTSHQFAAPSDVVAAAGAQAPSRTTAPAFYTRYGSSHGKVTCSRCHNPHGDATTNPLLLVTGANTTNQMCLACHVDFDKSANHGLVTHPLVADYAATVTAVNDAYKVANPGWTASDLPYKAAPDNTTTLNGNVTLVNGGVACTSCHAVHFADSDASTPDTFGATAAGDGYLLKHNGPAKENPLIPGAGDSICQTCHNYKGHSAQTPTNPMGCTVCHGGHDYDPNGQPNFYMLNKTVTIDSAITPNPNDGPGMVTVTLDYTTLTSKWMDGGNGYCEGCHDLGGNHNGFTTGDVNTNCVDCHNHEKGTFTEGGCNSCHGYAPTADIASGPAGFAVDPLSGLDYKTAPGVISPKNESLTAHARHANSIETPDANNYKFACSDCHNGAGHRNGNFQEVNFSALASNGGLTPAAYNPAGTGTCATLYCHSNGRVAATAATIPAWQGGSITGCAQCHGNDAATMTSKGNTPAHQAHLAKGYSCNVCHDGTAANNTTLAATAISSKLHVNGSVDILFDNAFDLGAATLGAGASGGGTCSVYCHSNGTTQSTPDWNVAGSGQCGTCHQYNNAGTATGSGSALGGAHAKHVFDAAGPGLACTACHTNAGSGADHVNGEVSLVADACNTCHGATVGGTGFDAEPVWTVASSVSCETCHLGTLAIVNGKTAPGKDLTLASGHGKTSGTYAVSGNAAANQACLSCHDANAAGHFDGISGDDTRLAGGFSCGTCHGTLVTHQAATCVTCHDPHGSSNIYMVKANSTAYSGTVVFSATTGADSYDEADSSNGDDICATCHTAANQTNQHNNKTNTGVAHNEGADCFTCHLSHTNPGNAFAVGGGDSCDSCHGFPPTTGAGAGAHALHAPDSLLLDQAGKVYDTADRSACAFCHAGADLYTYNQSGDATSGTAGRQNHGAGQATQVATLGTTVGYNGTTCASACHDGASGLTAAWNDTSLACDACHYESATPTLAGNNADTNTLSGTHSTHFAASAVCTDCHGTLPTDTAHITVRTGATELAKVQGMATAISYEATLDATALGSTGVDPTSAGTNATCNNIACHNPSDSTYSAEWTVANAVGCAFCHSETDPATGSHTEHLAATVPTTFGKTVGCADCHDTLPVSNAHRNGAVDFAAAIDFNNLVAGACSTTTCHNDGAGTAVATPQWGRAASSADDCTICHGYAPATGRHGIHLANTVFVANKCAECHTAETATTHIDGTVDDTVAYDGVSGGCANNCHLVSAATAGDWKDSAKLDCANCHNATGKTLFTGFPPAVGAHQAHTDNTAYVTGANCTDCHNNNSTTHSAIDGAVTSPTLGAKITTYNAGNGTCANSCHGGPADFSDSVPAPGCTDCHSGSYIGGGTNMPTSGLHNVTPTVSGQRHDDSVSGGCAACHTTVAAQATHINGTFTGGAGQTTQMGLAAFYTQTANNTGTCATTTCHTTLSDDWAHKWNSSANFYTTANTACAGCHGDWTQTWNAGVIHRTSVGTQSMHGTGSTYQCKDCHGLEAATGNYTFAFGSNDWGGSSNHGNATIEVNNFANYNETSGLCTLCHNTTDGQHNFADTGWTIGSVVGDSINASCGSCHTGGKTPSSSSGAHDAHGAILADETTCYPCHGDNGGNGYSVYTGSHSTGTVDLVGVTYSTATRNDVTGTCLTSGCHNKSTGTDQSTAWNTNALACDDCHYYATGTTPTAAGNTAATTSLSADHGNHFGTGGTFACATCHGTDPTDTTHISGTTLVERTNPVMTSATVTLAGWNGTDSCNNAACHNPSGTTYSATWMVSTASCTLCHSSTDPGTGSHDEHMAATTNFGVAVACTSCHGTLPISNSHLNNTVNLLAGMNYTPAATDVLGTLGKCSTSTCHNDGTAAATPVQTPTWNTTSANCSICHSDSPTSNKHGVHLASTNYVTGSCGDCHTAANTANHINGTRNLASKVTSATLAANGTCANTCHAVVDGRDWTAGPTLDCADCHGATGKTLYTASGSGGWPITSNKHAAHTGSNSLPQTGANDCFACHNTTVNSSGAIIAAGTHLDLTAGNVSFNSTYNYEALTAGKAGSGTSTTCSNIRCHNGVTTPTWAAASTISCGKCHNTGGTGPLPSGSVAGSHAKHANNDGDFADCAQCHVGANSYSATGGAATHQNLVVNIAPTTGTYSDANGAAGVNYSGDGVDNGTCANSCHGVTSPNWGTAGAVTCTSCHNNGTDNGALANAVPAATATIHTTHNNANNAYVPSDCDACHGAGAQTATHAGHINGSATVANKLASYTSGNGTCSNSCHNVTDGRDWTSATALACSDCHIGGGVKDLDFSASPPTTGQHGSHVMTMGTSYGSTTRKANASGYDFACGQCHQGTHMNGVVGEIAAAVSYSGGSCSTNACHNNGKGGAPAENPSWTTGFTPGDLCAKCHGNTPTTAAHAVHAVGIHASDIYTGTTGLQSASATSPSAHGDGATSTVISCNSCHNSTVNVWYNANNGACASCHDTSNGSLGDNAMVITGFNSHVNGIKDVIFQNIAVKSRAQVRDDITTVADLNANWTRSGGYKANASFDQAKVNLTSASYTGGTCSAVACHNGNDATWATPQNNCQACHTGLPK